MKFGNSTKQDNGILLWLVNALQVTGLGLLYTLYSARIPKRLWLLVAWSGLFGLMGLLIPGFFTKLGVLLFPTGKDVWLSVAILHRSHRRAAGDFSRGRAGTVAAADGGLDPSGTGFAALILMITSELLRVFGVTPNWWMGDIGTALFPPSVVALLVVLAAVYLPRELPHQSPVETGQGGSRARP